MADPFQPKFVDLVRNFTTTTGTGNFVLGPAANGCTGFTSALQVGDTFYYSAIGIDKPAEREVGRGTLLSNTQISRDPISGAKTNFTSGTKSIALIAAAEWFASAQELVGSVTPTGRALASAATTAVARATLELGTASLLDSDADPALAANSDTKVPSQKAVKAYVEARAGGSAAVADRAALASTATNIGSIFLRENGRDGVFAWDSSNLSAKVSADTQQGLHVAPLSDPTGASGAWIRKYSGAANAKWFGAIGDGATNDTTALTKAMALVSRLYIPDGTYKVSQLVVPSNITVEMGPNVIFQQTAGNPPSTPIVLVKSSNVRWGDAKYVGNIATDSGEWNHAVQIESNATAGLLTDIRVGRIWAKDIRGDALMVYTRPFSNTVTMTIAAPGVVTWNAHGLSADTRIVLTTTGALPTGLTANTAYYVRNPTANTFELSATAGGASITTSGTQSGTHTAYASPGKITNLTVGDVLVDNCYRNGVSICGAAHEYTIGDVGLAPAATRGAGMTIFDLEPDFGSGAIGRGRAGIVKGRYAQVAGSNPDFVAAIAFDAVDVDPSNALASSPAYPTVPTVGFTVRDAKHVKIGRFRANGHTSSAFALNGGGTLPKVFVEIDTAEVPSANSANGGVGHFNGGTGLVLHIGSITAAGTDNSLQILFNALTGLKVGYASFSTPGAGRFLNGCTDSSVGVADVTIPTGNILIATSRCEINGGTMSAAAGMAFGSQNAIRNASITAASPINSETNSYYQASTIGGTFYQHYAGVNGGDGSIQAGGNFVANINGGFSALNGASYNVAGGGGYKVSSVTVINSSGVLTAAAFPALTGDITTVAGALATTIGANRVTRGMLAATAGPSVLGATAAGNVTDLATLPAAVMPAHTGDVTSSAGSVGLTIATNVVTYGKIQQVAASSLVGNPTGSLGNAQGVTVAGGLTFSGSSLTAAGALTPTSVASAGAVTSSGATSGIGYAAGAGGVVTQATSKTTAVTLNKTSGQVTMNAASLAAAGLATFTVNNSAVAATDTINLNLASGNATAGSYRYWVEGIAGGSFKIVVENRSAGALAEALVFNFAVLKAVNA